MPNEFVRTLTKIELNHEDVKEVVDLHIETLPHDFLSLLGRDAIKKYYSKISIFFEEVNTYKICDNDIIGYIHFGFRPKKNLIFFFLTNYFFNLLSFAIKYPLYAIELVIYALKSQVLDNELLYIYVNKSGNGLGSDLLDQSIKNLNTSHIYVKTLASTQENIRFYEKNGFKITRKYVGRIILKKEI